MSERVTVSGSESPESGNPAVEKSNRRRWTWIVAIVLVLAVAVGYGVTQVPGKFGPSSDSADTPTAPLDSDGDGLSDKVEIAGLLTRGATFQTDLNARDTDGDGLSDGEEAGDVIKGQRSEKDVYLAFSNPTAPDTDGDGLSDAEEADLSLDPFDRDTDGDQIEDGREVEAVGTAPDVADTDGDSFDDGFEDASRKSRGLDPLVVDVKVSTATYAADFSKGAIAGDLWREDSLAWMAGNLTSGGASSIPVIGSVVGAVADLRDVIGSAIRADWVGSGFSAVGAVPGGDVVAIPGKAAKFVARNPKLAAATAAIVASATKVPGSIKVKAAKKIWGESWDDLADAGASEKALLQLSRGTTDLKKIAAARKRAGHVEGATAKFFASGAEGEGFLEGLYGVTMKGADKQVSASTKGCLVVCNTVRRRFDVVADGVAHESKVGKVTLTASIKKQIRSDAYLVETGVIEGAHWHFMASSVSNSLGPNKAVMDLLDELKIPYTIHLPA